MLFGCRTTRRRTVKYNGKVYKYDLDPPRRYYRCYGVQKFRLNRRNRSYIRAERLEELSGHVPSSGVRVRHPVDVV